MHRFRNTRSRNNRRIGLSDDYTRAQLGWEPRSTTPSRYAGEPTDEELRNLPSPTSILFGAVLRQSSANQSLTPGVAAKETAKTLGNREFGGRGWNRTSDFADVNRAF